MGAWSSRSSSGNKTEREKNAIKMDFHFIHEKMEKFLVGRNRQHKKIYMGW